MHELAEKTLVAGLLELGILQNATAEVLFEKRLSYYFMPHGLGHYLGLYVHDMKGDPQKENNKKHVEKQYVRVYRVLEENMILTNEPGIYFIEEILAEAKADKELSEYINWEKIGEYKKEVYGVRIEDNMVIT